MNLSKKQLKLIQKILKINSCYNYILDNCTKEEFQEYQILENIIDIELNINQILNN